MKRIIFIFILAIFFAERTSGQNENFDIVSYQIPAGWTKDMGKDFVAYTVNNPAKTEYARILIFKSLQGAGDINADFDREWKELVLANYQPGEFINTNFSDYKNGWVSKIGVAPFKYQNANHVAVLLTQVKANTKMSFVFISNTTKYQSDFENFGSSLDFGTQAAKSFQYTHPQQNSTQEQSQKQPAKSNTTQQNRPHIPKLSGFQYSTSNFDDGWTATIQSDYVLVEKGNARVYLYFAVPYNSDNFSGTGVMDRDYYWDNYIAKQFRTTTKQYNDAGEYISSFLPKYVEGIGTDPVTGAPVFVAMALEVVPNAGILTVASFPDEASFRHAFPKANDRFTSDLKNMSRYNKFAIGANDFVGTWQNGNTSTMQWAYETPSGYEGYAGMTVVATSAEFTFNSDGTYSSIQNGATGAVGAMATFQQNYKGKNTVTNWNMVMTNRWQGQTYNFDAYYQAVKGGRLLMLNDNAGSKFQLVKIK